MSSRSFNPAKTRIRWLRADDKRSWFRGQAFAKPGEPDRAPRFFNYDPARNSWTPNGVKTCYYALDIYTAFMECSAVFHEMAPAIARGEICIGASELDAIEVIEFCLKQDVALADMVLTGVLPTHNVEPRDLLSRDKSLPNALATAIYESPDVDVDGIWYDTRLGSKQSIAIFESSEDKVTDIVVLNRASLLDYVGRSLHDIERTFNCYIDFSL